MTTPMPMVLQSLTVVGKIAMNSLVSYHRDIILLSLLYTVMCNMNTIMLSGFCQCYGSVHVPGSIEFHSCLVCHSEKETM